MKAEAGRAIAIVMAAASCGPLPSPLRAEAFTFTDPDFDRWVYPFNGTNGIRTLAPTFTSIGVMQEEDFDNRDGQFLVGFDTDGAGIPTGLPLGSYQVASLEVTATHFKGAFAYDPTYDSYVSHLDTGHPNFVADGDTGRPIVLTGAALRNGFTSFSFGAASPGTPDFEETEPFGVTIGPGLRNAFAFTFDAPADGDVSNNVDDEFDFVPWAVGQSTSGLNPGDAVPQGVAGVSPGETFSFDVSLSDPDVLAYVRQGLQDGGLFFMVTSMQTVDFMGGTTNPNFYTRENFDPGGVQAGMTLNVSVPEPASVVLLAAGAVGLMARRRARERRRERNMTGPGVASH